MIIMSFKENLGLIYFVLPFLHVVNNKIGLILAIIFGLKNIKLKLNEGININFKKSQFDILLSLIGIIAYSTKFEYLDAKFLNISFDSKNFFEINLEDLGLEEQNLLLTLFLGTKYGADFFNGEKKENQCMRNKTFLIYGEKGKKIIETPTGIKFYLKEIHPGNTIVETFVNNIHMINPNDNWKNKIVLDVGAECGDTPLYYAGLGANVFAFEPIKAHYDAMIKNIELNPELSNKITPINAAIGKDEMLTFFQSSESDIAPTASFVYNLHGTNAKTTKIKGYSVETAIKEFKIGHVNLLKMDCKGCQFFLDTNSLKNVDKVKIEYGIRNKEHKLEDLTKILENSGFNYVIYRTNPFHRISNNKGGNIYGEKQSLFKKQTESY